MSDETALLRAIAAHPDEDTPRLIYADFLDERGRPERAAFVRGQIELARLKEDSPRRREVAFHCRRLLDAHEQEWLDPRDAFSFDWGWSRGFVETFTTTPADLESGNAELFATHPFRRVWLWELGDADGVSLLPKDNHITALDLIGNNLNANQLKKLARMAHLPHLRELGLMFNDLRDPAVRVLLGEPFFQRLQLIRLGANPFTEDGRRELRDHFVERVTFVHQREPDRLYTIRDDRLRVGWGESYTQFYMHAGDERQRVAVFDHAGNLLHTEERTVYQPGGGDAQRREMNRETARDAWLEELGYQTATIKVKRFEFDDGLGLHPFNWWAEAFDGQHQSQRPGLENSVEQWLAWGQYKFGHGGEGGDMWFTRDGEVTDT